MHATDLGNERELALALHASPGVFFISPGDILISRRPPMSEELDQDDLEVLIRTGITNPVAIGLAKVLLEEAEIPFFSMDQNVSARQESGNILGWWTVRVPKALEADAREILESVERIK